MNVVDLAILKKMIGGGSGTNNYNDLSNLPQINGETLTGNKTAANLGLQDALAFDSAPTEDSTNPVISGGVYSALTGKQDNLTFDGVYNASTNKAATESTVTNAIAGLDVSDFSVDADETISSISETDGKISVNKQDIAIASSQVVAMTGYAKPSSAPATPAIQQGDTANEAIGKLEYKADTNQTNIWFNTKNGVKNLLYVPETVTTSRNLVFTKDSNDYITCSPANDDYREWNFDDCQYFVNLNTGTNYVLCLDINTASTVSSAGVKILDSANTEIVSRGLANETGKIAVPFTVSSDGIVGVELKVFNGSMRLMICNAEAYTNNTDYQSFSADNVSITNVVKNSITNISKNKFLLNKDHVKTINTGGTWSGNTYIPTTAPSLNVILNNDGTVTLNGSTDSSNVTVALYRGSSLDDVQGFVLGGSPPHTTLILQLAVSPYTVYASVNGISNAIIGNYTNSSTLQLSLQITANSTFNNVVVKPMICSYDDWKVSQDYVSYTTPIFAQPTEPINNDIPENSTWVNGASVKGYLRTDNLFDEKYTGIQSALVGVKYYPINVGAGDFTLSTTCPNSAGTGSLLFLLAGNVSEGASSPTNGVYIDNPRTVTAVNGYVTIAYRYDVSYNPKDFKTMLNAGTTIQPYQPYLTWQPDPAQIEIVKSGVNNYFKFYKTVGVNGGAVSNIDSISNSITISGTGGWAKIRTYLDYIPQGTYKLKYKLASTTSSAVRVAIYRDGTWIYASTSNVTGEYISDDLTFYGFGDCYMDITVNNSATPLESEATLEITDIEIIPSVMFDGGFTDFTPYAVDNAKLTAEMIDICNNTSKNLIEAEDVTLTGSGYVLSSKLINLRAGSYVFSYRSTQAESGNLQLIVFGNNNVQLFDKTIVSKTGINYIPFTILAQGVLINVYSVRAGDYKNIMICKQSAWDVSTEYKSAEYTGGLKPVYIKNSSSSTAQTHSYTITKDDFVTIPLPVTGCGTYIVSVVSWSTNPTFSLYAVSYSGGVTTYTNVTKIAGSDLAITVTDGTFSLTTSGKVTIYALQ